MNWKEKLSRICGIILATLLVIMSLNITSPVVSAQGPSTAILVILKVEGQIQTEDLWTTGDTQINDWAKPMYYIWFDDNGDRDDARYGNGAGPMSAQIQFDAGQLVVQWSGGGDNWDDGDEITYGPIQETAEGSGNWIDKEHGIIAHIIEEGTALSIEFPTSLFGNPATLEVSAMASPWTSSAIDNTGAGDGSSGGWIKISNVSRWIAYTENDVADEPLAWPSELSHSDVLPNFNITSLFVQIGAVSTGLLELLEDTDSSEDEIAPETEAETEAETEGTGSPIIWIIVAVVAVLFIAFFVWKRYFSKSRKASGD